MKLTLANLRKLILEVIQEDGHQPFKSQYEREQHLKKQAEEASARRERKKELRPDMDLMKLSKGIMTEQELQAEPDEDGWVRIKASALQRVLTEQGIDIERTCNKNSYYKVDQILDFIKRTSAATKGK